MATILFNSGISEMCSDLHVRISNSTIGDSVLCVLNKFCSLSHPVFHLIFFCFPVNAIEGLPSFPQTIDFINFLILFLNYCTLSVVSRLRMGLNHDNLHGGRSEMMIRATNLTFVIMIIIII